MEYIQKLIEECNLVEDPKGKIVLNGKRYTANNPGPECLEQLYITSGHINALLKDFFISSLILPILWSLIFYIVTQYYLTYWVITNRRIISAKLVGLFNIKYASISLDKIQDLTVFIKGILPSIYHFGNLRIQTAGEKGQFLLDQIQDPEIVKQVIFEAKIDYQRETEKL